MTDQETAARLTVSNAAIRNELWDSRHRLASLHLEIQRADEAYAALGATLAAERIRYELLVAEVARVSAELHAAQQAHLAETEAHAAAMAAALAAHDEMVLAHRQAIADHADVAASRDRALAAHAAEREVWDDTHARLALAVTDYEAILLTRTFRWTKRARRVWSWLLARKR